MVHIGKLNVFSTHAPDEGVLSSGHTAVDGPDGRNHSLLIFHDDVSRFLWLTHHMENSVFFLQIEVEIHFHSSFMGVTWHGVPHTARFKTCHAHDQLTALTDIWMYVLIDGSLVEVLVAAKMHFLRIRQGDEPCAVSMMSWSAVEIELCRIICNLRSRNL